MTHNELTRICIETSDATVKEFKETLFERMPKDIAMTPELKFMISEMWRFNSILLCEVLGKVIPLDD